MLTLLISLLYHLFQPCSGLSFTPPPRPISYCPPIFYPLTLLLYTLAPASPPDPISPGCGVTAHLDGYPSHWPPPLVCTSLPCQVSQRSSSRKPMPDLPCLFPPPPCRPQSTTRSLLAQRFSCPWVPYSIYLTPSSSCPPHPLLPDSTGDPVSFLSQVAGVVLFLPLAPVHPSLPPRVPQRVLVSSEVIDLSFGCTFALRRESWAPPLPRDRLPNPLPPH